MKLRHVSVFAVFAAACWVGACGDEGTTPDCPVMPVTEGVSNSDASTAAAGAPGMADAGDDIDPDLEDWFDEASARGCATKPEPTPLRDASPTP